MNENENVKINCFTCKHFYITWDKKFPRGCKAYGFKTKNLPALIVYNSSGTKCLYFENKKATISS